MASSSVGDFESPDGASLGRKRSYSGSTASGTTIPPNSGTKSAPVDTDSTVLSVSFVQTTKLLDNYSAAVKAIGVRVSNLAGNKTYRLEPVLVRRNNVTVSMLANLPTVVNNYRVRTELVDKSLYITDLSHNMVHAFGASELMFQAQNWSPDLLSVVMNVADVFRAPGHKVARVPSCTVRLDYAYTPPRTRSIKGVFEFEASSRCATQIVRECAIFFADASVRALVVVKITREGERALAVLWRRNASGQVEVADQVDFGPIPISQQERDALAREYGEGKGEGGGEGEGRLPPASGPWVRCDPCPVGVVGREEKLRYVRAQRADNLYPVGPRPTISVPGELLFHGTVNDPPNLATLQAGNYQVDLARVYVKALQGYALGDYAAQEGE